MEKTIRVQLPGMDHYVRLHEWSREGNIIIVSFKQKPGMTGRPASKIYWIYCMNEILNHIERIQIRSQLNEWNFQNIQKEYIPWRVVSTFELARLILINYSILTTAGILYLTWGLFLITRACISDSLKYIMEYEMNNNHEFKEELHWNHHTRFACMARQDAKWWIILPPFYYLFPKFWAKTLQKHRRKSYTLLCCCHFSLFLIGGV